jgi:phage repressor protein C with HTH and peptisase S24 domain
MLTHDQIWAALDRLAAAAGLSPSGLAKKSGLDPTTFNRSKRVTSDGRQRWPSTESVAKALAATGTTIGTFVGLLEETGRPTVRNTVPLIGLAQAGKGGYFDSSGFPTGQGWEEIPFPAVNDQHAYALEISGDAIAPAYHEGGLIIVSPAASIRRGDRVVVKTTGNELIVSDLRRRTAKTIELRAINPPHFERTLPVRDVLWMARVVWASQ